tara:strand:- start:395 stop:640 length:246 start_codon:yes stop_codon:yes gene_type:complete
MFLEIPVLLEAGISVNDEIATHIHCLKQPDLTPEDRDHIQQNLARGCTRGLQLIALHQLHLSLRLDELCACCVDDQKMTAE